MHASTTMTATTSWRRPLGFLLAAALLLPAARGLADDSENATTVLPFAGSFSTRVPITVPAFRGIQPQISLAYTSSNQDGSLGVGWALGVGSTIDREGVAGTLATSYRLDGGKLINSCTTYGGTHCTRIESYSRITFDQTNDKWYVWSRDGSKATYTAMLPGIAGRTTMRWVLTRNEDTRGNHVDYTYFKEDLTTAESSVYDAEIYPDTVSYNGNTVKFYWVGRPDALSYSVNSDRLVLARYYLRSIAVRASSSVLTRAYLLDYTQTANNSHRSFLASVQVFGSNAVIDTNSASATYGNVSGGTSLPKAEYVYPDQAKTVEKRYLSSVALHSDKSFNWVGDFNGDGRTDIVSRTSLPGIVKLNQSTGRGFSAVSKTNCAIDTTGRNWVGDFDRDGRSDLYVYASSSSIRILRFSPSANTCYANTYSGLVLHGSVNYVADFNGDGRDDILSYYTSSLAYLHEATATGFTKHLLVIALSSTADGQRVVDFDGDGKADVWVWSSADLYMSAGIGFRRLIQGGPRRGSDQKLHILGDFNGDGKIDSVRYLASPYNGWYLSLFVGEGYANGAYKAFDESPAQVAFTANLSTTNGGFNYVVDVNGDGLADIVSVFAGYLYVNYCHRAANGTTSDQWPIFEPVYLATTNNTGDTAWNWVGDFDGDGRGDLVSRSGSSTTAVWAKYSNATPEFMSELRNGLGGKTTIGYQPSTVWPGNQLPPGVVLHTASSVTVDDGRGDAQSTTYVYGQAKWSFADREFLGFRRVTTTFGATGAYSDTYYWQRVGAIAKPEVIYRKKPDGSIVSFEKFMFTENSTPPYTSLVTQAWAYDCNGDAVVDANHNYVSGCRRVGTTYGWDEYGNMTEERQYGDVDDPNDDQTVVRAFAPNTTKYIVGFPAWEEYRAGIGTGGTLLARVRYLYDGATTEGTAPTYGNLTKKLAWNDQTGLYVGTTYAYDGYGNVTRETGATNSYVTTAYDSRYHLLPVTVTNALGHVQTHAYDIHGRRTYMADINGGISQKYYDALGRTTKTTAPSGLQGGMEYLSFGTVGSQRVRTKSYDSALAVWHWLDEYFDGLGRVYRREASDGVRTDTIYGASGKVWKKSLPYVPGSTVRYIENAYDELGRQISRKAPDGTHTTRSFFDGGMTITDQAGRATTQWHDAFGRATKVRQYIGLTSHDMSLYYDRFGRKTRVVDAGSPANVTALVYDSVGRLLQRSDPDTGLTQRQYDDAGRVTRTVDAAGHATTLALDVMGRVTRLTYADASYDRFTFDEAGHGAGRGQLTSTTSASGVTTSADYDTSGRMTHERVTIDSTSYAVFTQYDQVGRLNSITYPDGERVTYSYGSTGLQQGKLVSAAATVAGNLVTTTTYRAGGEVASMTLGNGVTTTYTLDAYGMRVQSIAIGSLATFSYGYDLTGRVTAISSGNFATANWSYGYDTIGRLTRAANSNTPAFTSQHGFDALGRVTFKSDVGSYAYDDRAHVHAVTTAGANTYQYDANGQMIAGGGRTISYDYSGRPSSITYGATTSFTYDAHGRRVKKVGPSGTVIYVGAFYEKRGTEVVKHYHFNGQRVARLDASGTSFLHQDHLGSTRLVTTSSGVEAHRYEYAPFGKVLLDSGTRPQTRRFTGQEADDETGLMYFNARYYDPVLGRFISPDPLNSQATNPQDLDAYAYALNDPVNVTDPTGAAPVVAFLMATFAVSMTTAYAIILTVVGTALSFCKNPFLASIGMVLSGIGGALLGGPLFNLSMKASCYVAAAVALATSPISPLDPTIKKLIGWAYTAACLISSLTRPTEAVAGDPPIDPNAKEPAGWEWTDKKGVRHYTAFEKFEDMEAWALNPSNGAQKAWKALSPEQLDALKALSVEGRLADVGIEQCFGDLMNQSVGTKFDFSVVQASTAGKAATDTATRLVTGSVQSFNDIQNGARVLQISKTIKLNLAIGLGYTGALKIQNILDCANIEKNLFNPSLLGSCAASLSGN